METLNYQTNLNNLQNEPNPKTSKMKIQDLTAIGFSGKDFAKTGKATLSIVYKDQQKTTDLIYCNLPDRFYLNTTTYPDGEYSNQTEIELIGVSTMDDLMLFIKLTFGINTVDLLEREKFINSQNPIYKDYQLTK